MQTQYLFYIIGSTGDKGKHYNDGDNFIYMKPNDFKCVYKKGTLGNYCENGS